MKIVNEMAEALENEDQENVLLCDLSKAINCICPRIILDKLERIGIKGLALDFFNLYLTERPQTVLLNGVTFNYFFCDYGVSQGLVLGPIRFLM